MTHFKLTSLFQASQGDFSSGSLHDESFVVQNLAAQSEPLNISADFKSQLNQNRNPNLDYGMTLKWRHSDLSDGNKKQVGSILNTFRVYFLFRLRRFTSFLTEVMTNCDVLSFSSFTSSISSRSSCGILVAICLDLLFIVPVAIFEIYCIKKWFTLYNKNKIKNSLTCIPLNNNICIPPCIIKWIKTTMTQRATTLLSHLINNNTKDIAMTKHNHTAGTRVVQIKRFKFFNPQTHFIDSIFALNFNFAKNQLSHQHVFVAQIQTNEVKSC